MIPRFFFLVFSGAAVNPDGPAPKGMLANYTVLLTTVPPSRSARPALLPPVSSPTDASTARPGTGTAELSASAAAAANAAAAAVLCQEEADVRDALVDRDVGESIVCRRRYRILPDFHPGDRPYVVRASVWQPERREEEKETNGLAGGFRCHGLFDPGSEEKRRHVLAVGFCLSTTLARREFVRPASFSDFCVRGSLCRQFFRLNCSRGVPFLMRSCCDLAAMR